MKEYPKLTAICYNTFEIQVTLSKRIILMCRFIAYLGHDMCLDEVLFKPINSLVKQSIHARELEHPLNGDGFGVGWYDLDYHDEPALFTSIQPAWNDRNLRFLAPKIHSSCFFAHIRAASHGSVMQYNCHPFQYRHFLFMHNGTISDFKLMQREVRRNLSNEAYDWIKGQTDSEHFAAIFINEIAQYEYRPSLDEMVTSLNETTNKIIHYQKKHPQSETTYINYVITTGREMLAMRYSSDPNDARTLYYSAGEEFYYENGACHMMPRQNSSNGAVLVVSEKLDNTKSDWKQVPVNHIVTVDGNLAIKEIPLIFN